MATAAQPFVGTLSPDGYVTNPLKMIDYILAHYFEVQNSQYRFIQNVTSFQAILATHGENFGQIAQDVRNSLFSYLSTVFFNIEMAVSITPINGDPHSSDWQLNINCDYSDAAGKRYSIGRAIQMYGKQFQRIEILNRTGKQP